MAQATLPAGTTNRSSTERPAWLYAAGAALGMAIVGSSFAVLDTLRDYPQSGGQAVRYAAGAVILVLLAGRRLPRPTARQAVRLALLAATGLAAFNLLVLAAEASMDPGSVGVIVAAVPVLLALAGPLQERPAASSRACSPRPRWSRPARPPCRASAAR